MTPDEGSTGNDEDEPLPPPIPGPEFNRLSRNQSVVAWMLGWIVGLSIAAGAIVLFVLRVT